MSRIGGVIAAMLATVAVPSFAGGPGEGRAAGGELRQGRYIGYLEVQGRGERLAVTADILLESPEDFTKFPRLMAIVKVGWGGYGTHEYLSQVFRDIRYDFDHGVLTFDEPNNDLVISAQMQADGQRRRLAGEVWLRSWAKQAVLSLEYLTDEPPDDGDEPAVTAPAAETPFAPHLEGQYLGQCEGKRSVFQIQTVKGLRKRDGDEGKELFDYEIVARLGHLKQDESASEARVWITQASFAGGSYNFASGKLVFRGPSTTAIDCTLRQGELRCSYRVQGARVSCSFKRESMASSEAKAYAREHNLRPTPEQLQELPAALPPGNEALASALRGEFTGYLHHETSNLYQAVSLRVIPSSSTENPHNPNKLSVSTTATLYFGRGVSEEILSQRYEPRSFYLRPGFTLNAPGTDSFISIEEWRSGYIRGVWYSHVFGRVGTVQLTKSPLPGLPASANVVQGWTGEFEDASAAEGTTGRRWKRWFQLYLPPQAAQRLDSTVSIVGSYQTLASLTAIRPIERGRYDPYTGALGWIFAEGDGVSLVSGTVSGDGSLSLYWPPNPNAFATQMTDYRPELYRRLVVP